MRHIDRQIPPKAHPARYVWHKYWARKTWNVVGEFVESYCPPDSIVLDPFAGSGVIGMEAVLRGRRAILIDLVPIMEEIVWATLTDLPDASLISAFETISKAVERPIQNLYMTKCPDCGLPQPSWLNVWDHGHLDRLRYVCKGCEARHALGVPVTIEDLDAVKEAERQLKRTTTFYPQNPLEYPNGQPFLKREKYRTVADLFTSRNLLALSMLMSAIDDLTNTKAKRIMKAAFTSMVHLCSRMVPVLDPGPNNHQTPFSSTWTQQSLWSTPTHSEINVWRQFRSAVLGHQGLRRARLDADDAQDDLLGRRIKIVTEIGRFLAGDGDLCLVTGSGAEVMRKMPPSSVDYIFTDPPYDVSIQYGELAFMWVAWLRKDRRYLQEMQQHEVVTNERQGKSRAAFQGLLRGSFEQMHGVLADGGYATVTFHNPSFAVRKATIEAGTLTGFKFEKIHHQPTATPSASSQLQPFGSARGDFYLRFHKLKRPAKVGTVRVDDERFEQVVVDTTIGILAERGEPTPYTFIINAIDPQLADRGFFSSLTSGLDAKKVLQKHLGTEFELVDATAAGATGKLWWFKDPHLVAHPEIPLADRVTETVLRELHSRGAVEFTDVWESIGIEFPNSLTPDTTTIREALRDHAQPMAGGTWLLRPDVKQRENQHDTLIHMLAELGKAWGYKVWIGRKEQASRIRVGSNEVRLRDDVDGDLSRFKSDFADLKTVEQIDCIWLARTGPVAIFEVEWSTSMTSALLRGSNLSKPVRRYLVIPEEREVQLGNKMRSPLFADRYRDDGWRTLHYDYLVQSQGRLRKNPGNFDMLEGAVYRQQQRPGPKPKQTALDLGV